MLASTGPPQVSRISPLMALMSEVVRSESHSGSMFTVTLNILVQDSKIGWDRFSAGISCN